jgi:hypothetical protein
MISFNAAFGVIPSTSIAPISFAMQKGIKHSHSASNVMNIGVISDGFLYCRTLLSKVFTVVFIVFCHSPHDFSKTENF